MPQIPAVLPPLAPVRVGGYSPTEGSGTRITPSISMITKGGSTWNS